MKKRVLFLVGVLPVICGYILNSLITFYFVNIPTFLVSIIFLCLWGAFSYYVYKPTDNPVSVSVMINAIGGVMLVMILVQELVFQEFFPNAIGMIPQMYFLPIINLAYKIGTPIFSVFTNMIRLHQMATVSFCLMFGVSLVGCMIKRKK